MFDSRTRIANISWDILNTWPIQYSWDLSIWRSGSTFRVLGFSQLRTLSRSATSWTTRKNSISVACTWDGIFLQPLPEIRDCRWGSEERPIRNWQLCGVWKIPFCDRRAIRLAHKHVCFTNPCINVIVPTSVSRDYHPEVLERIKVSF